MLFLTKNSHQFPQQFSRMCSVKNLLTLQLLLKVFLLGNLYIVSKTVIIVMIFWMLIQNLSRKFLKWKVLQKIMKLLQLMWSVLKCLKCGSLWLFVLTAFIILSMSRGWFLKCLKYAKVYLLNGRITKWVSVTKGPFRYYQLLVSCSKKLCMIIRFIFR